MWMVLSFTVKPSKCLNSCYWAFLLRNTQLSFNTGVEVDNLCVWRNHKQALFYYSAWHIPLVFWSCSIQLHFLPWSLSYSNAKWVWLRAHGGRESKNHTFRLIWDFLWSSESTSKHLSFIIFQVWSSFHRLQTSLHKRLFEIHKTVESRKGLFSAIYMLITILKFKDIKWFRQMA